MLDSHDGNEVRAAITHGFGSPETDGYNVLFNLELGKKDAIWYRDRKGRGLIGQTDLRNAGYDYTGATGVTTTGGTGAITGTNLAGSSVAANVRNPATNQYYSRTNQNTAQTGFTRNFPGVPQLVHPAAPGVETVNSPAYFQCVVTRLPSSRPASRLWISVWSPGPSTNSITK